MDKSDWVCTQYPDSFLKLFTSPWLLTSSLQPALRHLQHECSCTKQSTPSYTKLSLYNMFVSGGKLGHTNYCFKFTSVMSSLN